MTLPHRLIKQKTDDPLPAPSLTPAYVLAAVTTLAGLFATQGLITNGTEKLITGIAAIIVPLVLAVVAAIVKSRAHTAKANLQANQPAGPSLADIRAELDQRESAIIAHVTAQIPAPVQPPSAEDVAQVILRDAAGRQAQGTAEQASEQTVHPNPPVV